MTGRDSSEMTLERRPMRNTDLNATVNKSRKILHATEIQDFGKNVNRNFSGMLPEGGFTGMAQKNEIHPIFYQLSLTKLLFD